MPALATPVTDAVRAALAAALPRSVALLARRRRAAAPAPVPAALAPAAPLPAAPLPAARPAPATVLVAAGPKAEAEAFEDNRFWFGYRRPSGAVRRRGGRVVRKAVAR